MPIERISPGPGQESVWDYPRPPRLEDSSQHIQIVLEGVVLADTTSAKRVLETSHPPVYYIPPADVQMQHFTKTPRATYCEWKGQAAYFTIQVGDRQLPNAAWYYPNPTPAFTDIKDYIAVYPSKMDACYVDGEQVQAQAGDFYGGWITSNIVGPFKGGAGTWGW
ncbi:MAG: DUF427 domain-containing protein [Leptolyngbyaceae bacterium]|nr:DUF427 domain-containing protein [Leptolyngbyaceae bacterium]